MTYRQNVQAGYHVARASHMAVDETFIKVPEVQTIRVRSPDGREASIDFSNDGVTYSGELPVHESARIFFEAVFAHKAGAR